MLTAKEQTRLQILNSLLAEHMTLDQAATLMGVSTRHTRRILAAYREKGAAAVAHGHRGRKASTTTPEAVVAGVVRLARTRYAGTNHTHLSELLSEREGMDIGRITLRPHPGQRRAEQSQAKTPSKAPGAPSADAPGGYADPTGRQPPTAGWARVAPQFALLFGVDDATGTVVNALFCEQEDSLSYFRLMQGPDSAPGHSTRALHLPPLGLQAPLGVPARRHTHPIQPGDDGRAGDTTDIRTVAAGQGSRGAGG